MELSFQDVMMLQMKGSSGKDTKAVVDVEGEPQTDLESYVAPYKGIPLIFRLKFIGKHYKPWAQQAISKALETLKESPNVLLQRELWHTLVNMCEGSNLPYVLDEDALERVATRATHMKDSYESEVKQAKSSCIRASIKLAYSNLAEHFYNCGQLEAARKTYMKARDYITQDEDVLTFQKRMVDVAMDGNNFDLALSYLKKIRASHDVQKDLKLAGFVVPTEALCELSRGNFVKVAELLTNLPFSQDVEENMKYLCSRDVAVIGGLCALAMFDRAPLKKKVISNTAFKQYLEMASELREGIVAFHKADYWRCLSLLDQMKNDYLLDPHMNPYIAQLYKKIRIKALRQYAKPFVAVDMTKMAQAFHTSIEDLEEELADLVVSGDIQGRIDSNNKILRARKVDERSAAMAKINQVADLVQLQTQVSLLRASMIENQIRIVDKSHPKHS